jgi:two-component system response regulator HydG
VRELRNFIESMVVLDTDGVLGPDDVQDSDVLRRAPAADGAPSGPSDLVGRPLTEVERYYIEQALALTEGNREEAAKMLGIGERTLYRVIQDWKLQDRIKQALADANGDVAAAARALDMNKAELERKIKKSGLRDDNR